MKTKLLGIVSVLGSFFISASGTLPKSNSSSNINLSFVNNAIGGYYKSGSNKKQIVSFASTVSGSDLNNITEYGIKVYTNSSCSGTPTFTKSSNNTSHLISNDGNFYTVLGDDEDINKNTTYYAKAYAIANEQTATSDVMNAKGNDVDEYTIPGTFKITTNAETGGSVSDGGNYRNGESCTLVATPSEGYAFDGWYENDTKISGAAATYTFTVSSSRTLTAKFKEDYYKEVSYIQSSGTQYIDVGLTFNRSQPTAEIKFYDYSAVDHAHSGNLFGCYNGIDAWNNGWGLYNGGYNTPSTSQYWIHYNSNTSVNSTTSNGVVKLDRNKLYYNGTLIYTQGSVDSYQCNNTLYLLSGNFGTTTVAYKPSLKLEYFKFWLDDKLERNMVPCVLTSDIPATKDSKSIARSKGTVGMWDKVTDKFYGNIGTGNFTAP